LLIPYISPYAIVDKITRTRIAARLKVSLPTLRTYLTPLRSDKDISFKEPVEPIVDGIVFSV
jgi:hypothetical protein